MLPAARSSESEIVLRIAASAATWPGTRMRSLPGGAERRCGRRRGCTSTGCAPRSVRRCARRVVSRHLRAQRFQACARGRSGASRRSRCRERRARRLPLGRDRRRGRPSAGSRPRSVRRRRVRRRPAVRERASVSRPMRGARDLRSERRRCRRQCRPPCAAPDRYRAAGRRPPCGSTMTRRQRRHAFRCRDWPAMSTHHPRSPPHLLRGRDGASA